MRHYGETPGADMQAYKTSTCTHCQAPLLVGQVRAARGTLKWRNFNAVPAIRDGLRYYRPHRCKTESPPT